MNIDRLSTNNTCPFQNNKWHPFISIFEIERTLLLSYGTHNAFDTLNTSPESNHNDNVPNYGTIYSLCDIGGVTCLSTSGGTFSLCAICGATCLTIGGGTFSLCVASEATCITTSGAIFCSSYVSLLLLDTTCIGYPLNLYRFPFVRTIITTDMKVDHLGTNNTCPFENNMWHPFISIFETESTLLLSYGTHNTFDTLNTSHESNHNDTVPSYGTTCLAIVPRSTNNFEQVFVKVSNNSLAPVMLKDDPLSTNQVPLLETAPERVKTYNIPDHPCWSMLCQRNLIVLSVEYTVTYPTSN
jgi:hypothetical protein